MNKTATNFSQGCLQELYLQKSPPRNHIFVQLLAFQSSQANSKEIILRISDKQSFLDCILVGSFSIFKSSIVATEYSSAPQSIKSLDIIKITDYFCKIDPSKICQLRIIIRKIELSTAHNQILGKPEDISQFIENRHLQKRNQVFAPQLLNGGGTEDIPIKIEEGAQVMNYSANQGNQNGHNNGNVHPNNNQKAQDPLTLQDIMNNKSGYFIGRLVRYKFGSKEAKDGPMSFLYLGFLDLNGDIVRVHLAGRIAIRQSRQLKKGKVYYIKGLELFVGDKTKGGPQIRLRQKQYKIQQIQNEVIKSQYKQKYYRWQHQNEWIESQMVDVIGIVEEVEEKITYKNANTFQEQRDVVRLIIRNAFKSIKISFWADHINLLNGFNLKKKQPILIEDIKKKKTVFLDFISESNIIVLDEESQIMEEFSNFFPPAQEAPDPTNVKELLQVYDIEPFNTKVRSLKLSIGNMNWKWAIYKMCNECKKKVEKNVTSCPECRQQKFSFKYNCSIDLHDPTGTISCIAFDPICHKLFGQSANDFSVLTEQKIKDLVQGVIGEEFKVNIENKNNRLIIRGLQKDGKETLTDTIHAEPLTKIEIVEKISGTEYLTKIEKVDNIAELEQPESANDEKANEE